MDCAPSSVTSRSEEGGDWDCGGTNSRFFLCGWNGFANGGVENAAREIALKVCMIL